MADEIDLEKYNILELQKFRDLNLDLRSRRSQTVAHIWSRSTHTRNQTKIGKKNFFINRHRTDWRTYVWTDGWTAEFQCSTSIRSFLGEDLKTNKVTTVSDQYHNHNHISDQYHNHKGRENLSAVLVASRPPHRRCPNSTPHLSPSSVADCTTTTLRHHSSSRPATIPYQLAFHTSYKELNSHICSIQLILKMPAECILMKQHSHWETVNNTTGTTAIWYNSP